ncbi:nitrite reductase small subunit NirD [Maritalea mediterranea]|uniref:Nitrite reductase small subunit NirD n=1 Tax=Maritalea mediterranea TaxID=2909667 RepID=A0ABS9E5J9_9HYPH|nr:nitrite reductase small subunit NirD [Maritalea mediterranea]MCF4098121.1 nitrite reductase small subunit NirD [Maritalea mediterranea]
MSVVPLIQKEDLVDIGHIDEVPRRGARCVTSGDLRIAIFRTQDDQFFALEDKCPHKAGPLSQGIVHDGCVTCPLHNWVISLKSGEAQGADEGATQTFNVQVRGNRLLLDTAELIS